MYYAQCKHADERADSQDMGLVDLALPCGDPCSTRDSRACVLCKHVLNAVDHLANVRKLIDISTISQDMTPPVDHVHLLNMSAGALWHEL